MPIFEVAVISLKYRFSLSFIYFSFVDTFARMHYNLKSIPAIFHSNSKNKLTSTLKNEYLHAPQDKKHSSTSALCGRWRLGNRKYPSLSNGAAPVSQICRQHQLQDDEQSQKPKSGCYLQVWKDCLWSHLGHNQLPHSNNGNTISRNQKKHKES